MVSGLIASLDSASLQALVDAVNDVVGNLGFQTCNLYDAEATECCADDVGRETEVCMVASASFELVTEEL